VGYAIFDPLIAKRGTIKDGKRLNSSKEKKLPRMGRRFITMNLTTKD